MATQGPVDPWGQQCWAPWKVSPGRGQQGRILAATAHPAELDSSASLGSD